MDVRDHPADSGHTATQHYAGELLPVDFTAKAGSNWQKAGPSAATPREQSIKILNAPSTGNVVGPLGQPLK